MKILYISSLVFKKGSSASIRNIGLIEGMVKNGCKVDVLTIDYPIGIKDEILERRIKSVCKVYTSRLNLLEKYLNTKKIKIKTNKFFLFFKNFIKDFLFFPDVDKEWINKVEFEKYIDYDLVISSSDTKTSHYVAKKIIEKKNEIKWFQIWGDPWADDISLSNFKKMRVKYAEKKIISKADKVFYVSPLTLKKIINENPKLENKLKYLPRGYLEQIKKKNEIERTYVKIVYTGVINKNRNISKILDVIEKYNEIKEKKIKMEIYGEIIGIEKDTILKYNFIDYKGMVSIAEIEKTYQNSDILLLLENGGKSTQIPGKIYDYLGTECKILALFENKNEIYSYFLDTFEIDVSLNSEVTVEFLEKLVEKHGRKIDLRYSNDKIALQLLREL